MWQCFRIHKKREEERHFLENGGLLLEELITSFDGRSNPIRSFSKKELERATNNYHQDGFLHQNYLYKLYKGTYEDRTIWVKNFTGNAPPEYIGWYIKEVAVASHMNNHKNVLKLLGCCLETVVPTLVYEFAATGRLSDHIFEKEHSASKNPLLSWEVKLRIATEIADAIAYLHKGTSKAIIHRDINSENIFLDQHYVGKLFQFGLSLSIPLGETHVNGYVVGSFGFVAPESISSGRYSEKSDVYSFGMVLFEILTGKRTSDILKEVYGMPELDEDEVNEKEIRLYLEANIVKGNTTIEKEIRLYLEANIVKGNTEQLMACAELTMRCIKLNPDERPLMIEAAKKLRMIRRAQHDSL